MSRNTGRNRHKTADSAPGLSIFDTFKTKSGEMTGEAVRQRAIITALVAGTNPMERTRTAISRRMAERNGIAWKNIYSGVFRDLDEVLIPLGLVAEEGRLPLKRGPRALQEKGVPYYRLTHPGLLVSLALGEAEEWAENLERFLAGGDVDEGLRNELGELGRIAPGLVRHLFAGYVRAYCEGRLGELLPVSLKGLSVAADGPVVMLREILEGAASAEERAALAGFLGRITPRRGA